MPCRNEETQPSKRWLESSHVACLMDEVHTGQGLNQKHWDNGHPEATENKERADWLTQQLCKHLQTSNIDITKCSLELQLWWRDHQRADQKRKEQELRDRKDQEDKARALAKLTPRERELLGHR